MILGRLLVVAALMGLEKVSRRPRSNGIRELFDAQAYLKWEGEVLQGGEAAVRHMEDILHDYGEDWPGFKAADAVARDFHGKGILSLSVEEKREVFESLAERDINKWMLYRDEGMGLHWPGKVKVGGTWAVHVTNHAMDIFYQGFRQGVPYWHPEILGLTQGGAPLDEAGGWGFASPPHDIPRGWTRYKYGEAAVLLQLPSWLETHHIGDQEDQLIFSTEDALIVAAIVPGRCGYDVIGKDFEYEDAPFDRIEDAAQWAINNFPQYRRGLLGRKWRKAFA